MLNNFESRNKIMLIRKSAMKANYFILNKNGSVLQRKCILLKYAWLETLKSVLKGNIFDLFVFDPLCYVNQFFVPSEKTFDLEFFLNGIDNEVQEDNERCYYQTQIRLKNAKSVEEVFYISWLCQERYGNYNYEIDCEWDENKTLEDDLKEQELLLKSIVNQEIELKDLNLPLIFTADYYTYWIENEIDKEEYFKNLHYDLDLITSNFELIKIESKENSKEIKFIKYRNKLSLDEIRRKMLVNLEISIDSRSIDDEIDLKVAEKELEALNNFEEIGSWIKKLDYY